MQEAEVLDSFAVLPCRLRDVGSQRCWLRSSVMSKQSIMLYDVVKIECTGTLSFLCRTWPRLDNVGNGYVQFDGTVLAADVDIIPDWINVPSSIAVCDIRKATCSVVESVSVTVVVTGWKEFQLCSRIPENVLKCQVHNLLAGFVIADRHTLLCSRTILGKLYCWDRILFQNVVIRNNCSCGSVTHYTKISVVSVLSEDRFKQRTQKTTVLGGLDYEINLLHSIILQSLADGMPYSSHHKVSMCYNIISILYICLYCI